MRLNPLYLIIVFFIHSCNFIDKSPSSINNFIPKDASIIIRIHNPNKFKSDVLNNSLALNAFNNEHNYNFNKQIKIIESLSENNPILICLSGDKKNNSFTIITRQNKSDIEILAIGIGHDVSRYYSKAIKITDVQELGDVMISQLSSLFENKIKLN